MSTDQHSPSTSKKRKVEDKIDYDTDTQRILEEADAIQTDIDGISERCHEDVILIEQRYNLLKKPHLAKRNNIVSQIPNFWLTAMKNHPDLNGFIDETEEECLHHLIKFEVEEFDNYRDGYRLKFYFEDNPYFENTILTKDYHLNNTNPTSESSTINWKEGMKLSLPPTEPLSGRKRRFDSSSFFTWFEDNVDASSDDMAEVLREDIWHNPLQYFLVPDADNEGDQAGGEDSLSSSSDLEEAGASDPDKNEQLKRKYMKLKVSGRMFKLSPQAYENLKFPRGTTMRKHYFPFKKASVETEKTPRDSPERDTHTPEPQDDMPPPPPPTERQGSPSSSPPSSPPANTKGFIYKFYSKF